MLSPGLIGQSSLTGIEISVVRFPGDESPGYYHLVPLGRADEKVKLTLMGEGQGPGLDSQQTAPSSAAQRIVKTPVGPASCRSPSSCLQGKARIISGFLLAQKWPSKSINRIQISAAPLTALT